MTLDQATVAALSADDLRDKKDERDHNFRDDDLHGFGIRVRIDSHDRLTKTWNIQYRIEGKQRRQSIGKFPRMNAATARTKAGAWLNKVHDGVDPAGEREVVQKADALKFHIAVEQYLAKQREAVRESTFINVEGYLTKSKYFGPLHKKPLAKVTQSDVERCLDAIATKPSRQQAQKTLSALYAWAVKKGHAPENPVARCEVVKLKDRDRALSEDEMRMLWNALKDDDLGRVIKLLLLTACRADEIGGLRWSELDLAAGTLTLPGERTKNGRAHTLPLPPLALQIIQQVEKIDGRDFLFGKFADGFTYWAKQKALIEPIGLAHWTIHDLRRTAATHMCELGIEPHVVEAILNHASGHKAGVAGIHNRASYARQMKTALALWADHVESIVTGSARKVISLHAVVNS